MEQHLRDVIKNKVLRNDNPYLKCFIINNQECPEISKVENTKDVLEDVCNSLMEELGFRFKIEFQPECCFLKARKLPDKDREFELLKAKNVYARANINGQIHS